MTQLEKRGLVAALLVNTLLVVGCETEPKLSAKDAYLKKLEEERAKIPIEPTSANPTQDELDAALRIAAGRYDIGAMKRLISKGANINARNKKMGDTAIMFVLDDAEFSDKAIPSAIFLLKLLMSTSM